MRLFWFVRHVSCVDQCLGLRQPDSRLVLDRGFSYLLDLAQFDTVWGTRIESRLSHEMPEKTGAVMFFQQQ